MRLTLLCMKNMIGHQNTSTRQQCIREGREDFTRYIALVKQHFLLVGVYDQTTAH
jgi:hypothetical protein